tara:strand:+ start:1326 stop:1580 length:255 start_codon:yes stop_codon:yes gene_type:complete
MYSEPKNGDKMNFGIWLSMKIENMNMRPSTFAFDLNVTRGAVSLWLSGGRHPNKKMQKKIVDYLSNGDPNKRNQYIVEIFDLIP